MRWTRARCWKEKRSEPPRSRRPQHPLRPPQGRRPRLLLPRRGRKTRAGGRIRPPKAPDGPVPFPHHGGEKLALGGEPPSGKPVTALPPPRLIESARLTGSIRFAGREVLK